MNMFYCSGNYPKEIENPTSEDKQIFVISNGSHCLTYIEGKIGDLDSVIWNPRKDNMEFVFRNICKDPSLKEKYSDYSVMDINFVINIKLYEHNFYNKETI